MNAILLLLDQAENRRLLVGLLEESYQVLVPESGNDVPGDFDLCIVDGPAARRMTAWLKERREAALPVFLPVLLLTSRPELEIADEGLRECVDDLIVTPVHKAGLRVQVEILLRTRRLTQDLSAANKELEAVFNAFPDLYFWLDTDGTILSYHAVRASDLHIPSEQFLGKRMQDVLPPDVSTQFEQAVRKIAEAKSVAVIEYSLPMPDGIKFFEARLVPLMERQVMAIVRDITEERKRAEESLARYADELERSNTELQQFAYIASHDLQEPLRAVSGYLQLIRKRYEGKLDKDADEFIAFAVDGASRMQALIEGLLDYSRVGTHGKEFAPTDSEAALKQAEQNLKAAIEESGAEITHDPLPTVTGDDVQLTELLQNLVANAIKFHRPDEPPRIHVSAEQKDGEWVFSVKDNGIGIAREDTERLFRIFTRLHARDEYEGTGIGLAVCKRIVERHGGRIWVESEPGKGSTFYFTIPATAAAQPAEVEKAA